MQIITSFEDLPPTPMAFAIGTFDGLHRGHQAILSRLQSYGVPTCALTFSEHPLKTLCPAKAPAAIMPLSLKLLLLKTDFCLLLEFTKELASLTYSEFLKRLPASHIVLGKGSFFGKNREGIEPNVRAWAKKNGVCIEYIDKIPGVSSTEVRNAIQAGDLSLAEKLLGRPHLLFAPSQCFSAEDLVLPPDGSYPLFNILCPLKLCEFGQQILRLSSIAAAETRRRSGGPLQCIAGERKANWRSKLRKFASERNALGRKRCSTKFTQDEWAQYNTAVIKNRTIELAIPVSSAKQPLIFSFNPNEEFHV